ncbi:hypothetical protein DERF_003865 [Dermatophagoides farinae]|uniref:Uncharacterized protein n=1 Tax=Dermatophagoides farinae TaxID=6954 RepID=A0A922IFG5_DERFA|nr:hypothetical protein DERF_003865 [Dermatophagoides farinae]
MIWPGLNDLFSEKSEEKKTQLLSLSAPNDIWLNYEYFNESKPQNSGRFIFVYLRTDPEVIRKRIRKR